MIPKIFKRKRKHTNFEEISLVELESGIQNKEIGKYNEARNIFTGANRTRLPRSSGNLVVIF